jgi:hypothetical protein
MEELSTNIESQGVIPELTEFSFDESGHFNVALTDTSGIFFRVISGDTEEKLAMLHGDPKRKLVFIGDGDRLLELNGKTAWEILMDIGHHPDYARADIEAGMRYKMVVFKKAEEKVEVATWANILKIVGEIYEELKKVFDNQELVDGLMQCDISSIEWMGRFGENGFSKIHNAGKNDSEQEPRFMTYERYLVKLKELNEQRTALTAQAGEEIADSIHQTKMVVYTRLFLYNTLALFRLFTGKGFSIEKRGNDQIETGTEYVYYMLNQALSAIQNYSALEMNPIPS